MQVRDLLGSAPTKDADGCDTVAGPQTSYVSEWARCPDTP